MSNGAFTKEAEKRRRKGTKEERGWHQPPRDFVEWWDPARKDKTSGADIGGHEDAERTWAVKDRGTWKLKVYGIQAEDAWNTVTYRQEYEAWVAAGRRKRSKDFVSITTMPAEEQLRRWRKVIASMRGRSKQPTKEETDNEHVEPINF